MFEGTTFEVIMGRMLGSIPNNLDKREGSILYNALAPAAVELQNMYIGLDWIVNQSFADTQEREFLIRRSAERGIVPEEETKAILKGEFNMDIPVGSRFSKGLLNYTALEKIDAGNYRMRCETAGEAGNQQLGALVPIDHIQGLTHAELTEVLIPGEDEESTEHLRSRYFDSLDAKAFGGNIQDYKEKTNALDGVGGVKVYPTWNGGGTVKLVIIDSIYNRPSGELLEAVQTAIDPVENHGLGLGFAPIGHVVTVDRVEERVISISFSAVLKDGWGWEDIKPYVDDTVEVYLKELRSGWEAADGVIVRVSQIESRLLNVVGIIDISGTLLNEAGVNVVLSADEIPVKGDVHGTQIT